MGVFSCSCFSVVLRITHVYLCSDERFNIFFGHTMTKKPPLNHNSSSITSTGSRYSVFPNLLLLRQLK